MPDPAARATWVGLVNIGPAPGHEDAWNTMHDGQGGAVVWAAGRADHDAVFRRLVSDAADDRGWHVRSIDDVQQHTPSGADTVLDVIAAELDDTDVAVAWGPMVFYPDEDLSDSAFLAEMAQDAELTELQALVVATLSDMLSTLDLPRLDGTSFEVNDGVEVVLSPLDDHDHDLVIAIGDDTVDVDYGWAHETFDVADDDGLDWALQFILSALQGGVKVEVFRSWGRVRKVRTHVLMEGENWQHAFTMGMFIPPGFRDPQPTTHVVGFA